MTQVSARRVEATAAIARVVPTPRSVSPDVRLAGVQSLDAPTAPHGADVDLPRVDLAAPATTTRPWPLTAADVVVTAAATAVAVTVLDLRAPLVAIGALCWLLNLAASGHYGRPALGESRTAALIRVLGAALRALLVAAASIPLLQGAADHQDLLLLIGTFSAGSALVAATAPVHRARVVVVGRPREVRAVVSELSSTHHQVVAVCLTGRPPRTPWHVPVHVGMESAARAVTEHAAEAVVVLPGRHVSPADVRRLHWEAARNGAALYLGTGMIDVAPRRARILAASGLDILHVAPASLAGPRRALKDVVERCLAFAGLVALSPVMLALALAVRGDSPGPALFRQRRIGRDGREFEMLKFRSMVVRAESEIDRLASANQADGVLFKIKDDPRVSDVGRWLRRYSLDELPQLWNVVRGDMSLVGPRPALPREVAQYDRDARRRLAVKPGITGLWQVSGRSDLTWEQSVRLDLRYVDNWTLRLDLGILCRTLRAVLSHHGAY